MPLPTAKLVGELHSSFWFRFTAPADKIISKNKLVVDLPCLKLIREVTGDRIGGGGVGPCGVIQINRVRSDIALNSMVPHMLAGSVVESPASEAKVIVEFVGDRGDGGDIRFAQVVAMLAG